MKRIATTLLALGLSATPAGALEVVDDGVFVRVIDVGAGHAAVIKMPGGFHMVYDAGLLKERRLKGLRSVLPDGEEIDLMILSHADADHLRGVDEILEAFAVKKIIRPGYERNTRAWRQADTAIKEERKKGAEVIDLSRSRLWSGTTYRFGKTLVTVVSGFSKPPSSWGELGDSEEKNAGSIVIRLTFTDKSILFTGDAVGRKKNSPSDTCDEPIVKPIATEKFMIENSSKVPIDSDVLIAPHHGSDDASSCDFIKAVSPSWVIFPAGHKYGHPHKTTAERFITAGVLETRMLRTDRHDDEGNKEWDSGRIEGCKDPAGDDDIDIVISANGVLKVAYRHKTKSSLQRCRETQ